MGAPERENLRAYLRSRQIPVPADDAGLAWEVLRLTLGSPAQTAILPMQDVLGLGGEARMNTPGTASGNWGWRMIAAASEDAALRLRALTRESGRA
jgi:4-alpha-glucanotransferase